MEKPILFNTEMVQAILAGRKTETRRIVPVDKWGTLVRRRPYQIGDILWVRETWDFLPCIVCSQDSECCKIAPYQPDKMETADGLTDGCFLYRADEEDPLAWRPVKWQPAIHMPKQAARIFLEVTKISRERLWDISETGATAEGCYTGWKPTETSTPAASARQAFMWVWQIVTRKGPVRQSWAANPWVWVIRFKRVIKPDGWPG